MKQEQIKILIDSLAASDLSELEYSEDGVTLRLVKKPAASAATVAALPAPAAADIEPAATQCLAPLYGVVHLRPSPDEPAFVQPGQRVSAGQTLCIIEAMKVFNEVRAEADATIAAVLVGSGDEVDGGQPLFRFS